MKRNRKILVLTTLLCLLPMLVGALVYDRLPESMVTHWNLNGEPDGRSGRALAVFGLPGLLAGVNILMHFALNADPKRANMSPVLRGVVVWSVPLLSILCSGLTLAWALGHELRVERIMPCFIGLLLIVIGNYLPKTKQSYTMGIRIPWTLNSEENWNRTHRLAGFLWVLGGLYFIVMSFFGWNMAAFLIPLFIIVFVPIIYSYLLYRKGI